MSMFNSENITVNNVHMAGESGGGGPKRPTDITTLKSTLRKMDGVKVFGHPDNNFDVIFRISRENYFRSFEGMEVEGGGLILQSSWLEQGQPAVSMFYHPDLGIEERVYEDEDGNRHIGKVIVKREGIPPHAEKKLRKLCEKHGMERAEILKRSLNMLQAFHEKFEEEIEEL